VLLRPKLIYRPGDLLVTVGNDQPHGFIWVQAVFPDLSPSSETFAIYPGDARLAHPLELLALQAKLEE